MNASGTPPAPSPDPVGDPDEPVIRSSARGGLRDSVLGTRNLMTVAALGVVGSILVVPLTYLSVVVAVNPRGILIMCALMGAWIIPYLLPGVIVNKPGAFVIGGLVMGVISAFLTPQGPTAILGNIIGSCYVGAPVALLLYRKWAWWVYAISGVLGRPGGGGRHRATPTPVRARARLSSRQTPAPAQQETIARTMPRAVWWPVRAIWKPQP